LVPARDRSVYYPMTYVQAGPEFGATALRSLLGFDVASEPLRLAAIERTVRAGQPAATPPLRIIGVRGTMGGVVAFMAVGAAHRPHRDATRPNGVVLAAFEIAPMVKNITAEKIRENGMDLYLFDPARNLDDRRIYWHSSATTEPNTPAESALRASMHWQSTVTLIDQHWGAIVTPTIPPHWNSGIGYALVTLATGLAMTAVIVAFLLVSVRRSIELEGLTASLRATTEDLHRNTEDLSRNSRQIAHMARHDALTGLANRLAFRERIEEAIARRRHGEPFALFYLDLDHFKDVNDTLGHSAGDRLLCVVAERIKSCLRAGDTVARLGGDEFAIVLANTGSPEFVAQVAERLINTVGVPLSIDEQPVVAGVSIGIALAAHYTVAETLLKEADLALYEAKDAGRRTYRFFESRLRSQIEEKRALEGDLRRGLERGEFEVYYQPIVNIAQSRVTAFEALVRWNHPEQGLLAPGQFISFAEECGFIGELDSWVLRSACEQAARWPQPVRVAVNISPLQFKDENLVADVSRCLALSGLPAQRLEIEITEAAVLQESAPTKAALDSLRAMGVTIALDDFGTGFSSLSSLLRFPFDKLKIDCSFVAVVTSSESASAIVRAIVGLGSSLSLGTTGEGVETPEQLADLRRLGCTEAQGYLFSRPRPNSEVPRLLHELDMGVVERMFTMGT